MEVTRGGQTPNQEIKLDISKAKDVLCTNCDGKIYEQAFMFKKVSKLLTGAPNDQFIPIQGYRCMECGEMLNELLPEEFRTNK